MVREQLEAVLAPSSKKYANRSLSVVEHVAATRFATDRRR
jgi:hypothetical protein